jgi:hypothetical protein
MMVMHGDAQQVLPEEPDVERPRARVARTAGDASVDNTADLGMVTEPEPERGEYSHSDAMAIADMMVDVERRPASVAAMEMSKQPTVAGVDFCWNH